MATMDAKNKDLSLQRLCALLKNKAITFLTRPQRAQATFALLVIAFVAFFLSVSETNEEPKKAIILEHAEKSKLKFDTFDQVATYLRGDDDNLVRPGPSEETWQRQDSEACRTYLDQAHQALAHYHAVEQDDLVDAVRVISLCTTNRPEHRAKLTQHAQVPVGILSLLRGSYRAMAAASECIWISSFASQPNHKTFVKTGAIEQLSRVITNQKCRTLSNPKEKNNCFVAQMWAAAALQNLAAAYCEDDEGWAGGCDWVWNDENETNDRHAIVVDEGVSVVFNPEPIRVSLIQNKQLVDGLTSMICTNVKELDKAPWERTWPSRAQVTDDEYTESVATWGAIGAIRNLALSPEFHDKMPPGLEACLCKHAKRSPDWLESSKAVDSVYRLGLDVRKSCEPLYDKSKCSNLKDWEDYEGNSCQTYEKERWCAEFRNYMPTKEEYSGDNYVKAGEACCACGGGNQKR